MTCISRAEVALKQDITGIKLVYECPDCAYVYEEEKGCAHEGYPAGTRWSQLPDNFPCPSCFVREKPDFMALVK